MSNGQENNTNCEIHKFERNNYFYGKLMTVRDFETEQSYFNEKRHLLNRLIHGSGLVCGLSIENKNITFADFDGNIRITFTKGGVALDCCGNEIIVPDGSEKLILNEQGNNLVKSSLTDKMYLYLKYKECMGQKVAAASNPSSCEETCCSNRIIEDFEVIALTDAPTSGPVSCPPFSTISDESGAETILKDWWLSNVTASCPTCAEPKVFLAVLKSDENIDTTETKKYSYTVHNNKLLSDLLKCHLTDFNNPHKTTADQVKALKTVNGVGNIGDNPWVSNVEIVSTKNTITRKNDLANNLIDINTIPSTTVTSVETTPNAGSSSSFSPGDHVHDLSLDVVERKHLNNDVINNLIDHDDTITVTSDDVNKKIKIQTNPATTVTNVGSDEDKTPGISTEFSRGDHIHDLKDGVVTTQKIADGAVDGIKLAVDAVERNHLNSDVIKSLLDSDGSITIEPDDTNKKINIKTARVGASNTGVVIFPPDAFHYDYSKRLTAVSGWIDPKLGEGKICVILGLEQQGEVHEVFIGHPEVSMLFQFPQTLLASVVDPRNGMFRVGVIQNEPLYMESVWVRWWASLPGNDLGEVTVISIQIEPTHITLQTGSKFRFVAVVNGTEDQSVSWYVLEENGGKINEKGVYIAPDTPGTYRVEAISNADPTRSAIATVEVISGINVAVDPANVTLQPTGKQKILAMVTGTTNIGVDWNIQESNGGKIEPTGPGSCIYYAPGEQGIYHVIAKSRADPSKTGTAIVTVVSGEIKYVQYKVFEAKELIVQDGLCPDGVKNCKQQGNISGGGYYGMMGDRVALNGVPGKLVDLVIEQTIDEKMTLSVGESWNLGGGWTLTAQAIDARAEPRQAWLLLTYEGNKLDDIVVTQGSVYTYVEEITGEKEVPVFVTYMDAIFEGALQLRYTWAVSRNVTLLGKAVGGRRRKKTSPK